MSHAGVLHDTSIELRAQIANALETTPEVDFGLEGDLERITLLSPGATLGDTVLASLYLYHVEVDPHRRNQRPLPDPAAADQFRRPPLPLRLRYLFTPVDDSEETNHLLLGRVVQHFHDVPAFGTFSGVPIGDSHGGADPELRVVPDMLPLERLSQLWNAFNVPYRVSVGLLVETAAVDSALPATRMSRAETLVTAAGRAVRS